MFQQSEQEFGQGALTASLSMADALPQTDQPATESIFAPLQRKWETARARIEEIEWAPDLGQDIGSKTWFRGVGTLSLLCVGAWMVWPGMAPLKAAPIATSEARAAEELRSQMIMPLAFGSDTGRAMGATDAVVALRASPERPTLELAAVMGRGDSFSRVLQRAGVGGRDASAVADMIAGVLPLSDIKDGTRFDMVLGRRTVRSEPRPLDQLSFRARFDLNVEIARQDGNLVLTRKPIVVDSTPLRIRGTVGSSLYRSARAAGAPTGAVQAYLKTLSSKLSLSRDVSAEDEFDLIVEYKRAETGEIEMGELLYAGLTHNGKPRAQLMRWTSGGQSQWFEANGIGEERGEFARPVSGAISSGYGMRRHPILGYRRMHAGLDFKASYGTPIYATADGVINYAGRKGGFGRYVKIAHGGNLASGYAHMSRIAVSSGQRVRRGQIIGYVGSTGLSTGPHLHYELYRGGRTIDPRSVRFTTRAELSGRDLANFKASLQRLMQVTPGAALQSIAPKTPVEPEREIERLAADKIV